MILARHVTYHRTQPCPPPTVYTFAPLRTRLLPLSLSSLRQVTGLEWPVKITLHRRVRRSHRRIVWSSPLCIIYFYTCPETNHKNQRQKKKTGGRRGGSSYSEDEKMQRISRNAKLEPWKTATIRDKKRFSFEANEQWQLKEGIGQDGSRCEKDEGKKQDEKTRQTTQQAVRQPGESCCL